MSMESRLMTRRRPRLSAAVLKAKRERFRKLRYKHGESMGETKEYQTWKAMMQRCTNQHHKDYAYYGGRGITVCEAWEDYATFLSDMGRRPSPRHTLDREKNDGPYAPWNCRWATKLQQSANTRTARLVEFQGIVKTIRQWSLSTGIYYQTLIYRFNCGWSPEKALTTLTKGQQ